MQLAWPFSPWYEPSAQLVHTALPLLAANEPGVHSVGAVDPVAQKCPLGHVVHWSTDCRRTL